MNVLVLVQIPEASPRIRLVEESRPKTAGLSPSQVDSIREVGYQLASLLRLGTDDLQSRISELRLLSDGSAHTVWQGDSHHLKQ